MQICLTWESNLELVRVSIVCPHPDLVDAPETSQDSLGWINDHDRAAKARRDNAPRQHQVQPRVLTAIGGLQGVRSKWQIYEEQYKIPMPWGLNPPGSMCSTLIRAASQMPKLIPLGSLGL